MIDPTFQLIEPLFKANFSIFVGDFADVIAYLKARDCDTKDLTPHLAKTLFVEKDGGSECILWFRTGFNPTQPADAGVLAHEGLHAVHMTLNARGLECSSILDETGNYFLEWLVRHICISLTAIPALTPAVLP